MTTPDNDERTSIEETEAIAAVDAVEALLPPPAVKVLPALAATATDLIALRTAVVDAAGVSAGLWLSYLGVLFYLLVAAGAVTHKDLFFESPVKLPFLGIDLPLKGFFFLGPGLFLIVHTYILLHFSLLAGKVQAFNKELWKQIDDFAIRSDIRRQLPANIFVQALAGPSNDRNGVIGFFLWLIALISLVIGPVVLLWFFELQFLPYHDGAISNWHRIAVGIDLFMMWLFWWRIALRDGAPPDRRRLWDRCFAAFQRGLTCVAMAGLTGFSAVLLIGVATFPGEEVEAWYGRQSYLPARAEIHSLRKFLVEGEVNPATRAPESWWSDRLVLPGLNVVVHLKLDSDTKIDFLPETVSLRKRNFDDAVLTDAVLRKVDLTGAFLRRARLDGANLQGAVLKCVDWPNPEQRKKDGLPNDPICAQLQGASLNDAQLQGASLNFAQLQGASLRNVFAWRTDIRSAATTNAWIARVEPYRSAFCNNSAQHNICDWTPQTFKQLTDLMAAVVPEGPMRQAALKRIDPRLNPAPPDPDREGLAIDAWWNEHAPSPPAPATYETEVAAQWQKAACAATGAPHVVAALARRLLGDDLFAESPFSKDSPQPANLAAAFLSADCAGAKGLAEDLRAQLRALLPPTAVPPKP